MLRCLTSRSWRGCDMFSMMFNSLCSILLSTTSSSVSRGVPRTQPAFLITYFSIFVRGSDAAAPADSSTEYCTRHNRLVEDLQRLTAHIKWSKLPQEVESPLSLPADTLCVAFSVQSVVEVDSKVSLSLHHLHLLSKNGNVIYPSPGPPKNNNHLFGLDHNKS